ncbi:hypothetical protein NBRC3257_2404 [Gluconobacter thailandicus NBRC 3257]|uniref:Uncharacterized protein n=1 Tax=Gluconobacter thailandicus NBRC 3257 TaxID=1381097 RepID=A0ABQ0IYY0_GLUTH|nr:hypothetical protein B932_3511 [Gluconobacter oxydans H24]GAC87074.1 hypothetical protein NBRC3255_0735 [Gluconobacter thailandicus NBRC 3255]GAD27405.1 hypothetical protein NBRC3257_2404 [Gluconobacter thailandicus NBRC 3257]
MMMPLQASLTCRHDTMFDLSRVWKGLTARSPALMCVPVSANPGSRP